MDHPEDDPTLRGSAFRFDDEVGPYRLLEPVGSGAMGEVWRAEQRVPVRRIVALKLIKKGMDTREVVTRFEIERQAMALMEHPGIAKVYDAGETREGRPYIAMEYVAGEKITDYCERHRLSIDARLLLFQRVCQAIQHAHQKAVIHRDLKPSNILVTEIDGQPQPKIIDFGIAKATAQRLTDRSAATFVGQLIGTPVYMSPEQVAMSAAGVDTRADVYSLGVILYELLSGALPHDPESLANAALVDVLKILSEVEAPRPSTRVSTLGDRTEEIAMQRGLDPKKLSGRLRGDLDWITLKALEKDPKRRYESPRDFADDIQRHLRREAVLARPPSVTYRTSRFARRHRGAVLSGASLLILLIAFAAWQTVQANVIARERDRSMANERLSLARGLVADDPSLAVAYALASLEALDQPAARDVVRRAYATGPMRDEWSRHGMRGNPLSVDASRDGRLCAVAWSQSVRPNIGIYDLSDMSMRVFRAETEGFAGQVAFDASATYVAAVATDGVHLWRVADGAHLLHTSTDETLQARWIRASADGRSFYLMESRAGEAPQWAVIDIDDLSTRALGSSVGRHAEEVPRHRAGIDARGRWVVDYRDDTVLLQAVSDLGTEVATELGRHPDAIASVVIDDPGTRIVSKDVGGLVRLWDLAMDPPGVIYEDQEPRGGGYIVRFDPHGPRFLTLRGSSTIHVHSFGQDPPRKPQRLFDRTHLVHDGTFLPDGSIVTVRNGIFDGGAVAHWRTPTPQRWELNMQTRGVPTRDGRALYGWMESGEILRVALDGIGEQSIEMVGRTTSFSGAAYDFLVSGDENVGVTYAAKVDGLHAVDLRSGAARLLSSVRSSNEPLAIDYDGGRAAFIDVTTSPRRSGVISVVDVRSDRVLWEHEPSGYQQARFDAEGRLIVVGPKRAVRFAIDDPTAMPDTLWTGEHVGSAWILDEGTEVLVADAEHELWWIDLVGGQEKKIGRTEVQRIMGVARHPDDDLVAVVGWSDRIEFHEVHGDRQWKILIPSEDRPFTVGAIFDPLGRSIYTAGSAGILAWRLPLDPLFGEPDADAFLERTRSLTNLRVVPDREQPTGFRIVLSSELGP